MTTRRLAVNPTVFFGSGSLLLIFVIGTVLRPQAASEIYSGLLSGVTIYFGWFLVLSVALILPFALWLAFGPFGDVRLGEDDSRPEFSTRSWLSMLFSAGMGIGLLFFSVAEPLLHYRAPEVGPGETLEAARHAMFVTFFHWGLHAWAIFACMGAALAYVSFRLKQPLSVRSTLYPLIGERAHGPLGHLVDMLAVLGTVFGLATSLGLGAGQIGAGLQRVFGVNDTPTLRIVLIAAITLLATASLVSGLKRGIRILSELNIALGLLLLSFVFLAGPTLTLLNAFSENLSLYVARFIPRSFHTGQLGSLSWMQSWTIFYWSWWIAWSPFVGIFIARISKGRTLREFMLGVLIVPTFVTFAWLTVFGNSALELERSGARDLSGAVAANTATAIYELLGGLPWSEISSMLAIVVVVLFFVTSSDSGSFVVDILTSGGNPDPPVWQRVFWAVTEGLVAAVLLYSGGLQGLQAAAVATGLPFCIVLLALCVGFTRALNQKAG